MGKKIEYWDIYDIDRNLTGRIMKRNDFHMAAGDYHLSVLGIVTDPQGRFLITQRGMDKLWAPGAYEVPGGGVQAGESSEEAVKREVSEETGLCAFRAEELTRMESGRDEDGHEIEVTEGSRLAVDLSTEDCRLREITLVGGYHNDDDGHRGTIHNYLVDIYHLEMEFTEADVHVQLEEAAGAKLATIEEIRAFGSDDAFLHYTRLLPIMERIAERYC